MGATPNEEIQRQHEQALALVADDLECSPSIDHGEISLHQKEIPTEESLKDHCGEEKKEEDVHFICVSSVSSRGDLTFLPCKICSERDTMKRERKLPTRSDQVPFPILILGRMQCLINKCKNYPAIA